MQVVDFERLLAPSPVIFTEQAFHIGPKNQLGSSTYLIPCYLRDGKELNPRVITEGEDFDDGLDYFTVCAMSGNVDRLASFLARHALESDINRSHSNYELPNIHSFASRITKRWLIAVVDAKSAPIYGEHDCGSFFIEYGTYGDRMPLYRYFYPELIRQKLLIPDLGFTRTQKNKLLEEGRKFYLEVIESRPEVFPFKNKNREFVSKVYQLAREQELAVKTVLLQLSTQ